jgi:predicted CXXCH cytochrome family protein
LKIISKYINHSFDNNNQRKKIPGYQIFLLISLIILSSCASEKRYSVLSFFFDGVPDPNAKVSATDTTITGIADNKEKLVQKKDSTINHPPYIENSCKDCHDMSKGNRLNQELPDLCYQCHEDFGKKFKVVHGPVASGFCTQCHDPHNSKIGKLLIREGQSLCLNCHEKKDIMKNDVHSVIEDQKCWDCHDPHGGMDKTMIR